MTTPDPALDAALDKLEELVVSQHYSINEYEREYFKRRISETRAAVVACAAPAAKRVEKLEAVAMTARSVWICDLKHPDSPHREACIQTRTDLYAALLALDGESEDAGAGVKPMNEPMDFANQLKRLRHEGEIALQMSRHTDDKPERATERLVYVMNVLEEILGDLARREWRRQAGQG